MKLITYWETAPGRAIPPYVALGIASMRAAFGESFLFLTKHNTPTYLGESYTHKQWKFSKHNNNLTPEIASIVAKSDFIRMSYVHHHGGFWLDADSIVFENFLPILTPDNDKTLLWHSEAFFGATQGNEILGSSQSRMLSDEFQAWGNPGGIKSAVSEAASSITPIPYKYINPGYPPGYSYQTCEILLDKDLPVDAFLKNRDAKMMKMYNTDFSVADIGSMTLQQFFDSETLIARIFLKINADVSFWENEVKEIIALA